MKRSESTRSSFYVAEFAKNLMKPRNIPIILYLLIDSVFIFIALMIVCRFCLDGKFDNPTQMTLLCALLSFVIYIGSIALSLSRVGEAFLRWKHKCKRIKDDNILNRVEPLFNEVYERAKELNPKICENIRLFIQEDDGPNAFSLGRRTVCITTGLLALDDRQIKAVMAHEFGHLSNQDTDLTLVVNVANTFIHLIFIIIWVLLFLFKLILRVITLLFAFAGEGAAAVLGAICDFLFTVISFVCVRLVEKIWNIIGNLLLMFSSRGAEFKADLFAKNLGYGDDLINFFETFPDSSPGKRSKFTLIISKMSTIGASHPATWRRIENLRK